MFLACGVTFDQSYLQTDLLWSLWSPNRDFLDVLRIGSADAPGHYFEIRSVVLGCTSGAFSFDTSNDTAPSFAALTDASSEIIYASTSG